MTPILTDERIIDQFEAYQAGKMNPETRDQLNRKLDTDPEWQKAYQVFLLSRDVIALKISGDLKSQMQHWSKETESNNPGLKTINPNIRRLNPLFRYAIAASILFLMAFSFVQYQQVNRFPDLAISEYQGVKSKADRNQGAGSIVDQLILNYVNNTQSAGQTIEALKQISPEAPGIEYPKAQNYLGRLYLMQGACTEMATAYQNSAYLIGYKYDGDIARVLCALKQGSNSEEISVNLKNILADPEHSYHDQAVEIDKKINTLWWSLFK